MGNWTFDYVLGIRHFDVQIGQMFVLPACLLKYDWGNVNTVARQANHNARNGRVNDIATGKG